VGVSAIMVAGMVAAATSGGWRSRQA